jgi:HEPN domain-containing protein/predicted nucleotidyltransferase
MVTIKNASEVADALSGTASLFSIVLFGSVARNNIGNDLDLAFFADCPPENIEHLRKSINLRLRPFYDRFAVDPFVFSISTVFDYNRKGSVFFDRIFSEGKVLFMKETFKQWKSLAKEDLSTAQYLFSGEYYRGCCYHAQQSVEKQLKALLMEKGWLLEKIHNIRRLTALCSQYDVKFDLTDDDIDFMDSIYRGRYPAETGLLPMGEPTKQDAENAVRISQKIVVE